MRVEDLSPADREIVQLSFLRSWLGRKRRARFAAVQLAPARRAEPAPRPVVPLTNGATGHTDHARRLAAARRIGPR